MFIKKVLYSSSTIKSADQLSGMEAAKTNWRDPEGSINQQMVVQQPSSPNALLSSKLFQEVKRLDLAPDGIAKDPFQSPGSQEVPVSSMLSALQRSFVNSLSRRPPRPPSRTPQVQMSKLSTSGSSQGLAAQLWLMKPNESSEFERTGQLRGKKRLKKHAAGRTPVSEQVPRKLSRFGKGLSPYEKVQKALTELEEFRIMLAMVETELKALSDPQTVLSQPQPQLQDPVTTSKYGSSFSSVVSNACSIAPQGSSSSAREVDIKVAGTTVEDVIDIVEEYLRRVPRTLSVKEMKEGLKEIQTRVGVDPRPSWYDLMSKSYMDFWDCLTGYFKCRAV